MAKYLRIISIPRSVNLGEPFEIMVRIKSFIQIESIEFLYCKKDEWFQTTSVRLEKKYVEDEYQYFGGNIIFEEDEFYTHYCVFRFKVKKIESTWIAKRNPKTKEIVVSADGKKGYHFDIYVTKEVGKPMIRVKSPVVMMYFYQKKNEIFCLILGRKKKINRERMRQEIVRIIGLTHYKNFYVVYHKDMKFYPKDLIRDAFYEEKMYFELEGISIREEYGKKCGRNKKIIEYFKVHT